MTTTQITRPPCPLVRSLKDFYVEEGVGRMCIIFSTFERHGKEEIFFWTTALFSFGKKELSLEPNLSFVFEPPFFIFIFLRFFFLMWTNFKVFIEFVTILLLFYVLVFWPRGMWDLSSQTRDQTCTPYNGR